ncbi:molecular chaperone DnaJ [candidate division KSB1 bacterium]|nr:molecular chaperone DnaJ [candidate division KSB1 bacterium]
MSKDYYHILGVEESASSDQIKKAYRELAKKYHPDANRGNAQAEDRFKEISEAYSVVSDPQKRKQYDQMRKYGGLGAGGFNFGGFDFGKYRQHTGGAGRKRTGGFSFEDLFGGGGSFDLGDIFGDLFGGSHAGRQQSQSAYQDSTALFSELTIPFELAIQGGRQIINVTREEACKTCKGTGAKPGTKPETCPSCKGQGSISVSQGFFAVNRTCPNCYGRGKLIRDVCPTCHGKSQVRTTKKLAVTIPAGIDDGAKLRLRGQGNPIGNTGKNGDIVVTIRVTPHRFFKRDKNNVYCEVPLDIIRAIKGTKIRVKTVYNKKIEIKIPPRTGNKKTFRLKGLGITNKKGTGDQFVTINVIRRTKLNDEEKKIVDEFEKNK